jgi:hypothetical protein
MQVAKTKLAENTPNPSQALAYLRSVAKSYSAVIPGASSYVDSTFDGIDKLTETHGDEVNKIVSDAYNEIKDIVSKQKTIDLETAIQVLNVIKKRGAELSKLAADIGSDALGPILDKHPEVKEALGGGWNEFKERAQQAGDKGQDALNEVTKSVQDIFKGGFSPEAIAKAKDTIQKKAKELQEMGQAGAKKTWDEAMRKGGPYLDKFPPQIKEAIQNNSSLLMTLGGAGGAGQIWKMIQSGAEKAKDGKIDEETVNRVKDFIEKQVKSAKEKGSKGASSMGLGGVWASAQSFLGEIPDFDKVHLQSSSSSRHNLTFVRSYRQRRTSSSSSRSLKSTATRLSNSPRRPTTRSARSSARNSKKPRSSAATRRRKRRALRRTRRRRARRPRRTSRTRSRTRSRKGRERRRMSRTRRRVRPRTSRTRRKKRSNPDFVLYLDNSNYSSVNTLCINLHCTAINVFLLFSKSFALESAA